MNTIRILLATAATLLVATAQAQNLAAVERAVSDAEKDASMRHATVAVSVYNITKNTQLYSHNANRFVTPASVAKIFTTGAGFELLGSDFRFKTVISCTGNIDREGTLHGNIYITGGGDPLLGSYRYRQTTPDSLFRTWTAAIRKRGIKRIDGKVCYNSSVFDDQALHDSWTWGDVGNYYGAGAYGLNFHENMYFVYFNPGKKLGYPASVNRIAPKNLNVRSNCEVATGPENSGDRVTIYGSPFGPDRAYRGTVPLGQPDFGVRGAMPNPPQSCAEMFATYLRTHDIAVSQNVQQVFTLPDSAITVLDYFSSPYYIIAQYTNLTSNNIYAESIFKYLGYLNHGRGSFDNGAKTMGEFFSAHGLDDGSVRMVDGSGLSRLNRVTADFVTKYLSSIAGERYYDDFAQSLAETGKSGTARNMLPDLPANVTVRVKTGSIDGVRAYAGYITTASGDLLSFAVIANDFNGSPRAAAAKLEKILLRIAGL
ncbi:MAG: D-alanyl-D-alanine carboxypeptidase/D-alanyl-D-alanine-endopeptidase [Bacteroidales bacterium]|nr:D-alanyl-D-alanine carboxypeptidase/D-alanyl-D-alanine-endopeptidase [Bacteroidales bacterium]